MTTTWSKAYGWCSNGKGSASCGEQRARGKAAIYNQRPDLVILDMMMPRMGGYPVLEHFRDKPDAHRSS